jgi:hypothetical protein
MKGRNLRILLKLYYPGEVILSNIPVKKIIIVTFSGKNTAIISSTS